ncbi:MAG: sensor histidine kinase, partial [Chloroflexi bacterium]
YITKPIHQAEVLARVKTHLRIRDLTLSLQAQAKTLQKTNAELNQTLAELKETQSQLVESEKMAALGGLVAGIAHEINTPIGVGVTAASTLHDETQYFLKSYASGHLKRSELDDYIETAQTSSQLILANLQRAADLVKSFKQVAVDQSSLEYRQFLVKPYLEDILLSLTPQLKHTNHIIEITGDDQISVTSYPGALSQVVTNLVMNSLMHAYQKGQAGHLHFHLACNGDRLILEYSDDGCGMTPETLKKIYNPFFTTKQGRGGSGLGLHIVYNVVTQKMRGTIQCESQVGVGTKFMMKIPLNISTELPESAVPENVQL